jgi:hypothetical protein
MVNTVSNVVPLGRFPNVKLGYGANRLDLVAVVTVASTFKMGATIDVEDDDDIDDVPPGQPNKKALVSSNG